MNFTERGFIGAEELTWSTIIQTAVMTIIMAALIALRKFMTLQVERQRARREEGTLFFSLERRQITSVGTTDADAVFRDGARIIKED